jgi:UDP-N-acetylmuramoylalanine--D-glutamate ligase
MFDLDNKRILVVGLGGRGRAACQLLRQSGARVVAVDQADTPELRANLGHLTGLGIDVSLGVSTPPQGDFSLVVLSPAVPSNAHLVQEIKRRNWPLISELELGYQQSRCLSIAIAGTNGKGTTAELVQAMLEQVHRKTVRAGHRARPLCGVVEQTKELDFLVLQVSAAQLEQTEYFRPVVAVLLNLASDHKDRYPNADDYARANARLFRNQQVFDWAIVQSEALRRLHELELPVPAKVITFSAHDRQADLHLERGLLLSRVPGWSGPLLDLDQCRLRGPHNAENLMAALAVGHVLRLPLETIVEPLRNFSAGPHRFELVAEFNGVQYINDSKATNLDALHKALLAAPTGRDGEANIWLIAGGKDQGLDYHDLGPVLSQRVKHAFLIGEAAEKIRAAWSLFTPCTVCPTLVKAVADAAKIATSGDVVLLSPACSSLDQFRNYQERGERFSQTVKSISRGA